jgi:hypothetical protein
MTSRRQAARPRCCGRCRCAIRVVTSHWRNQPDSSQSPVARVEPSSAPHAASTAFSASYRQACPRARVPPRWGPTSLTSLQCGMVVRDGRREPQPVRGSTASRSREVVGRPLPRGSLPPWAPRTNEKPWQERRRPRGSYRPLPTRTIHDVVTYANAFGRPHARYKNGLLAVSRRDGQAGSIGDEDFHVSKTAHDFRHHSECQILAPLSNIVTGQRYKRGNGTRVLDNKVNVRGPGSGIGKSGTVMEFDIAARNGVCTAVSRVTHRAGHRPAVTSNTRHGRVPV